MTRRINILVALVLLLTDTRASVAKPTIAVLPFAVAKERGSLQWLSYATASTLTEKMRRIPSIRVIPVEDVVRELKSSGVKPEKAAWTPAVAAQPIGRWLGATVVVVGAVGKSADRAVARQILEVSGPTDKKSKAKLWLAARFMRTDNGETLGRVFLEGNMDEFFQIQHTLIVRIAESLGISPEEVAREAVHSPPTDQLKAYRMLSEVAVRIQEIRTMPEGRRRKRAIKRALKKVGRTLKIDPEYSGAHAAQGVLLTLQQSTDEAISVYARSAALDPDFTTPHYGLADLAFRKGDLQAASLALESVITTAPWDDNAHHLLGEVYRSLGEMSQAQVSYEKALQIHQTRPETRYQLGQIYLEKGQFQHAISVIKPAIAMVPGDAEYHAALATAYVESNQLRQAIKVLENAEGLGISGSDILMVQSKVDMSQGRITEGTLKLEKILQQDPSRLDVLALLANAYVRQGRYAESVVTYRRAMAGGEPLGTIAVHLAMALEALGETVEAEKVYRDALAQAPDQIDIRMMLVKRLLERHDREGATDTLLGALQHSPPNKSVHLLLGDLYEKQGEIDRSILHYEQSKGIKDQTSRTLEALGRLYNSKGDFEKSITAYNGAIEAGASGAGIHASLANSLELKGDLRLALGSYRDALRIEKANAEALSGVARLRAALNPPAPKPDPVQIADRARALLRQGNAEQAKSAFIEATKLDPSNGVIWNDLGTLHARDGEFQDAVSAFEHAEFVPEAQVNLARILVQQGEPTEAANVYQKALNLAPGYVEARVGLGAIRLNNGEIEAAIREFETALFENPENLEANLFAGNAYALLGSVNKARKAYQAAADEDPGSAPARIGLGNIALSMGDTTAAIDFYSTAIELTPEDPAPHNNLGTIFAAQGLLDEAISEYQAALELEASLSGYLNLALLFYESQQHTEVLTYCKSMLEMNSDDHQARMLIGMVAHDLGEYDKAIEAYHTALLILPDSPEIHHGLGAAYEAIGDTPQALKHWEQLLLLAQENPAFIHQVEWVLQRIKALKES